MTQLVGRFERPLFRFLVRLTGDAHLAEDLFQETFLRLHRARNSYQPTQPLKPYLYRIALNAAHDARSKCVPLAAGSLAASAPPPLEQISSSAPQPAEDCQLSETRTQVRAALAKLPEAEREVVLLRIFEELSFAEIAQITKVPVPTAKSRMLYALRRLRPALEGLRLEA